MGDGQVRSRMRLGRWLRRRWQFATIPHDQRCSYCSQHAEVFEELTTTDGPLTRIRRVRYCERHHRLASETAACEACGLPLLPEVSHGDCAPPEEP